MPRDGKQGLAFLLGLWLALWLSPFGSGASEPADASLEALARDLHEAVNQVRTSRHLQPLSRRPELDRVARGHSADMAARHYVAHESPEGANVLDRLATTRRDDFTLAAENIGATNRASPNREILNGWLQSQVHRTNLLSPAFNETGIGVARMRDGTLVYTQVYVTAPQ